MRLFTAHMRPALFVQDIQNTWLYDPDSNQNLRKSVERRLDRINEAICWFRERKLPIIVGYTEDPEQGLVPGKESFEVPESLEIQDSDYRVTKFHSSAFANPELGAILRKEKCDTFVILGLSASGCVLATYFSALDWDVHPYLLKGCVASAEERHVKFAEEICETTTIEDLASKML